MVARTEKANMKAAPIGMEAARPSSAAARPSSAAVQPSSAVAQPSLQLRDLLCCCDGGAGRGWAPMGVGRGWGVRLHLGFETSLRSEI
ncbi:hypothetical protein KY285_016445 [Solanum tuberosum]|nr:hypothetical protein KY284_016446 [Solanum tuberosum]KAH0702167.1 hypothetical protein KY285_016445 [Solanum tuberosum]